jgi:PAS domain S-box-containing protein
VGQGFVLGRVSKISEASERADAARGVKMTQTERDQPETALGESIRVLGQVIDEVMARLSSLSLPRASGDHQALAETSESLRRSLEELEGAHKEIRGEMGALAVLLEAERSRYRDLFEAAPGAYLITDAQGVILEANSASEGLLRLDRQHLTGKPLASLVRRDDVKAFRITLSRIDELETVSDWELNLCTREGDVTPALATVACVRNSSGKIRNLRWLFRDITERKRLEEQVISANIDLERRVQERTVALEAANEDRERTLARLEAVLDQMPAGIVIADASTGKVVSVNERAEKLLGDVVRGRGESSLDAWLALGVHPDGTPYLPEERPITHALVSGETVRGEQIEFQRLDGTRVMFETSAAPVLSGDGKIVAAVAAYWDVTERERRARAEREFVTNAAHELRTPLAALASAVEVLQSGAKENPQDRDRFLAHVEEQCNRLRRLVLSLLVLARAQTGLESAHTEVIDVKGLLEEVAAHGQRDRVRVEPSCEPGTAIQANRELAEQALLNLVANAAKYAPRGEIVLSCSEQDGLVTLEVLDSGPGMEPEDRERALERFYRGRENGGADGFGLGLAIASQVADALRGKLEIEPGPSGGTMARLTLPAASVDA